MRTSLFNFHLPESFIASEPANPRDSARMLVVGPGIVDSHVAAFAQHLRPNDIVVFNNTRVIPARLLGKRGEASVEVLLHKRIPTSHQPKIYWQCFAKPAKRLRVGDILHFSEEFSAEVIAKHEDGQLLISFEAADFEKKLPKHGTMPLPPYIEKKRQASTIDEANYQTIYAQHDGSVAAPTAGLHFTENLLDSINASGAKRDYVTLHVGGGTFLPVKTEYTNEHKMHSEWAEMSEETAEAINTAKASGGRVIAVGTTSLRTLESACADDGAMQSFRGETNIFITPGYRFKCVDLLLTNFHLPKSTLFMLVSAFSGLETMQKSYAHAIAQSYRFYSYGDACLLYRKD